ncbi:YciI family protein [Actinomycetes bacterium KLBMP 9759]
MEFMILMYGDERAEAALSDTELKAIVGGHRELATRLRAEGRLVCSRGLSRSQDATTVRRTSGQLVDGPYTDTAEQLGGFYLVDVADADEAVDIARSVPESPGLTIEIRPTGS